MFAISTVEAPGLSPVNEQRKGSSFLSRFTGLKHGATTEQREQRLVLILSLVIGALAGLAVVAFIVLTERVGMRLYPPASPRWRRLVFPGVGSLVMGWLLYRYFPNARGSGVPQTKAALFARDGRITLRTVLGKFFCTSSTLACGIPLGREGPSVQVAAGIASVLARRLGLRPERVKQLVPVGAAAGLAAAFNTPIAAVLFSLEEIMGDLNAPVLGSVVLASATAWVILRLSLGNHPLFKVPQYELVHPVEFAVYAVLGVAGGIVSATFSKLLLGMREWFLRRPRSTQWIHPLAGGLLVGAMGWFVPQVLGVGYGYVGEALNGHLALNLMLWLVALKLLAVTTCYASGNAGGIFGPSLFIGATLGGSLGSIAHHLFPAYTASSGAYALVGMGALFAGIVRAPMTSVIMIFEMTQDYSVIVPLMIANLISLFVAARLHQEPVYEALAVQDGIHLPTRPRSAMRQLAAILRPPELLLPADKSVAEALAELQAQGLHTALVVNEGPGEHRLAGVLSVLALQKEDGGKKLQDLVDRIHFPHAHADQGLDIALERMGAYHIDILPVVSRADARQLVGIVRLHDILEAYGLEWQEPAV